MKRILFFLVLMLTILSAAGQNTGKTTPLPDKSSILLPDRTCRFASRDTCDLYLDVYYPVKGSETTYHGKEKPTILYVFGGGFVSGERDAILQLRWYKRLVEEGFKVVAIDYRLGMKYILNQKISKIKIARGLVNALQITVDDLYAATRYLIANGPALGIDPDNLVVSGSSAGAMAVLQADYQMSNRNTFDIDLPYGYRYKGVMSFSGGVFSREGRPDFNTPPAPTLLMHGTDDHIVPYHKRAFFNIGFFGSDGLARRFRKYDSNYNILRYQDSGHEVAASFTPLLEAELSFIYNNVMDGKHKIIDATLCDPGIDTRFKVSRYKDVMKK